MTSFKDLKRNREKMFEALNKQVLNDKKGGGRQKDERIWYPSLDATGNGFAVIRFLPSPGDEAAPYIRLWSYGFRDKGGWYIENSRTTLGMDEQDPVHQSNKALRAEGTKAATAIADKRKAQQSYFANIYVVRDPANPENEGKTFLFRFGAKIWDRIQAKMNPEFEGETAMNPFDLWEGANFRMKIKTEKKTATNPKGFRNYDSSEWDQPAPLSEDESLMESAWKNAYSLKDLIAPDKFKSFEDLKARFEKVTGEVENAAERAPRDAAPEPRQKRSAPEPDAGNTAEDVDVDTGSADDEDLEYYQNLLKD